MIIFTLYLEAENVQFYHEINIISRIDNCNGQEWYHSLALPNPLSSRI